MAKFGLFIGELLETEGKYVNDPSDSGGETNYGITVAVARAEGYKGAMKDMPVSFAEKVYKKSYWDPLHLDEFKSQPLAEVLCDMAVNTGVAKAKEVLQKMINYMTTNNIAVDRVIGRETLSRISQIDTKNEEELAILLVGAMFARHHLECMDKAEKNEKYGLGWLRRDRKNILKSLKPTL